MEIRKAKIGDIDKIAEILQEVQKIHIQNRPDIFREKTIDEVKIKLIEDMNSFEKNVAIAKEKNKILGAMIVKIKNNDNKNSNLNLSKILAVDEIGVREGYQKQGIGKMLIEYAKKYAKEEGCARIELNCWRFNQANTFYKKVGFDEQRIIYEMKI